MTVAVVVGAGAGIGRACALGFARAGADVVVAARRAEPLQALAEDIASDTGRRIEAMVADLADPTSCSSLTASVVDRFGGVDSLVCVAASGAGRSAIDNADWDDWRAAFEVNVLGTLEVSRCAARSMAERGGGAIVHVGSFGARSLPPGQGAYTATKQAALAAARTLAKELGPSGVRVNVVTPGYTTGADLDALLASMAERRGEPVDAVAARLASTAALRRHVDPDDIAAAVLFLCSDAARSITGVELPVTAGQHPL
jgi:NAD(P)-dependent dehydrogenase (short-subunit alcohol dehydrogenase family)